jgi:hypothetical protein
MAKPATSRGTHRTIAAYPINLDTGAIDSTGAGLGPGLGEGIEPSGGFLVRAPPTAASTSTSTDSRRVEFMG